MLTQKQLEKFVRLRNTSGYWSNLAFISDLDRVGKKLADLGPAVKFKLDGWIGYQWDVPVKGRAMPVRMIEFGCHLGLDYKFEDVQLFELVKQKAVAMPVQTEAQKVA